MIKTFYAIDTVRIQISTIENCEVHRRQSGISLEKAEKNFHMVMLTLFFLISQ
jgi:hypothetical protein